MLLGPAACGRVIGAPGGRAISQISSQCCLGGWPAWLGLRGGGHGPWTVKHKLGTRRLYGYSNRGSRGDSGGGRPVYMCVWEPARRDRPGLHISPRANFTPPWAWRHMGGHHSRPCHLSNLPRFDATQPSVQCNVQRQERLILHAGFIILPFTVYGILVCS